MSAFDPDLVARYDKPGPRYTSYPTAVQFLDEFDHRLYRGQAQSSNELLIAAPLSLYFHIPFCSTLCFYCACNKVVTRNRDRARVYLGHLYQEIDLQSSLFDRDREVVQLHLGGGTPTFLSMEQLSELMRTVGERFKLASPNDREFSIEIDPRTVNRDALQELRDIGFNRISLGVQDFDPAVQQAVHRVQSPEDTMALIEHARDVGFQGVNVDLIYGLPHQNVSSFEQTLNSILTVRPDRLSVFNYAHLPQLFSPQKRIKSEDLPSPQEKLSILANCVETLTDAGYEYIGMDHFSLPEDELATARRDGTLYRNFQGYSTRSGCDLVGMGVSAISQVGDCYTQNCKDLEAWQSQVASGQLAIARGLMTNRDDRIRAEVIQALMCRDQLDLAAIGASHGIDTADYFRDELADLKALERDGLIRFLRGLEIEILPMGRYLLRSIAMVFDRYLPKTGGSNRFSRMV